ncbi:Hypothetical_protein [Hexamita inflata]|uniref:Hypothetical_protein n=1 Tax=Hexamita inflata TaxID=28002 RepID=A0ABP1JAN4_9EUKA
MQPKSEHCAMTAQCKSITAQLDANIANNVSYVLQQLMNNSTALECNIINNQTLAAQNLISNFSVLDKRVLNNITLVNNQISNQASQISSLQTSLSQTQIDQNSIGIKLTNIQTVLQTMKYVYIDSNRNACDQYGCYKV